MGARFSVPVQTGPGAHPSSCKMGTWSFPGVKCGRSVLLTTHPLLVPWSRKSRDIPLLSPWAVRHVQSLSACTRVRSTPRPQFTPEKDPVPILQEDGWAPGPVWTGAENLAPTWIRSRTVQPVAQSLYRLSYRAHLQIILNK